MKVLAILLLCAFVAVQGRSAGEKSSKGVAALGDAAYLVHLRIAVSTSGLLNSGAGSLISDRWVLTAADFVSNARFVWIRYAAVSVINPQLVTESSTVRSSPNGGSIALISIGRSVQYSDYINKISLGTSVPSYATVYGYGANEDGSAGETLSFFTVNIEEQEDGSIIASSDEGRITEFDVGAPLVSEDAQVGVVVQAAEGGAVVVGLEDYLDFIASETGLELRSQPEDSLRVHFIN